MTSSAQNRLLRDASALKMRAMRLRNFGDDGDDQWQAIKLLRQAARQEISALEAQDHASAQADAGARIEACGLFLEGRDPVRAAEQWERLPRWVFFSEPGAALLERLKPIYDSMVSTFTGAWSRLGEPPGSPPDPHKVPVDRISELLDSYGGVAELWWARSLHKNSPEQAEAAGKRAIELEPSFADAAVARSAWERVHGALLRTVKLRMRAERREDALVLDAVSRIAAKFGDLLGGFVDRAFGNHVELVPCGATMGSFILEIAAQGLPPHTLEELDETLTRAPERANAGVLRQLLALLQQNRIHLTVSVESRDQVQGAGPSRLVIDARRRKTMIAAAEAAALRTLDSNDVPQANELERVFRIVEMVARREALDAEVLGITPRQVSYYRRAAKILGFISESDELSPAGKQIARLGAVDRLRATVVHFESSSCGNAWIQWSKGKTLRDVRADTANEFLRACVPGLSADTADRRAQTLIAWHRALASYHYALG